MTLRERLNGLEKLAARLGAPAGPDADMAHLDAYAAALTDGKVTEFRNLPDETLEAIARREPWTLLPAGKPRRRRGDHR